MSRDSIKKSSCEEESVYQPLFFDDISSILRGHGDGPEPIKETVILVEKILLQQLRAIVNLLLEIAYERKKTYQPSLKDVEYLMRLHPQRIYRLKKHLSELQYIMKIQDLRAGRIRNEMNIMDVSEDEDPQPIVEKYDEEKTRRIFRVDRITQFLNESQYSAYVEARRTSFYHSPAMKMKLQKWLSNQDIKLTPALLTILVYLSHETIAILVDHCILSRLSSSNRSVDPFNRTTSNGSTHTILHLCPEVTQGRAMDGVKQITVQEIHEAIRRLTVSSSRSMGLYKNATRQGSMPLIAL